MPKTSSAASGTPAILLISEAAVGGPFYPAIFASFQTLYKIVQQNVFRFLASILASLNSKEPNTKNR